MKRYRVAIIGLGRMGSTLDISVAEACAASDRLEVVAGADILAQRRDDFRQRWGVEAIYEDYRQMIEEQKPDLVAVCTTATGVQKPGSRAPSTSFRGDLHAEMTVEAANLGGPDDLLREGRSLLAQGCGCDPGGVPPHGGPAQHGCPDAVYRPLHRRPRHHCARRHRRAEVRRRLHRVEHPHAHAHPLAGHVVLLPRRPRRGLHQRRAGPQEH